MASLDLLKELSLKTESKIVMLVMDGLGGLPHPETGKTELETAVTPNLDALAAKSALGLLDPISPGISPGSGPGHLALFGYDPLTAKIGRGVLEAIGIDFELKPGDVAARGNFTTADKSGIVSDRRAGRISTERNAALCRLLDGMEIKGVRILVAPVREHRFVAIFRGEETSPDLTDTDPSREGVPPLPVKALSPASQNLASIVSEFVSRAQNILAGHEPANMILLRGFSRPPNIPSMSEIYRLSPAAIAGYPMYRGLAKLIGMSVLETGSTVAAEFQTLKNCYRDYDFFFVHVKGTDTAGEDGDFERKVSVIEQFDRAFPVIVELNPDVIVVTGDHSTPAVMKAHSWHPVPVLLYSRWCRPDGHSHFDETACRSSGIGRMPMVEIMPLIMANALKLTKFGA